jgi:Na+/H+-dicarboxylate symporter
MKRPTLTTWILVGLVAGVVCGLAAHYGLPAEFNDAAVRWALKPMGDLFLRAITMMVVPVVVVSLTYGAASLGDPCKLGRVGLKVMVIFTATTVLAIVIALVLAAGIVHPGESIRIATDTQYTPKEAPFIMDVIVNMMPRNPLKAMAEAEMLQLIAFALLLGVALAQIAPGRTDEYARAVRSTLRAHLHETKRERWSPEEPRVEVATRTGVPWNRHRCGRGRCSAYLSALHSAGPLKHRGRRYQRVRQWAPR